MAEQELRFDNWPTASLLRSLSPNGRSHFYARSHAVRQVHERVKVTALAAGFEAMHADGPVVMRATFYFPVQRQRDDDNLSTGVLKAARDALVRCGYLAADDVEHLRQERPQVIVTPGQRALVLHFSWAPLAGVQSLAMRDSIVIPGKKKREARPARKRPGSSSASRKGDSKRAVPRF